MPQTAVWDHEMIIRKREGQLVFQVTQVGRWLTALFGQTSTRPLTWRCTPYTILLQQGVGVVGRASLVKNGMCPSVADFS